MKTLLKTSFFLILLMGIFSIGMNSAYAKNTSPTKNYMISLVQNSQADIQANRLTADFNSLSIQLPSYLWQHQGVLNYYYGNGLNNIVPAADCKIRYHHEHHYADGSYSITTVTITFPCGLVHMIKNLGKYLMGLI